MSRRKMSKSGKVLGDASATAEDVASAPAVSGGSAMAKSMNVSQQLLQHEKADVIQSPFGQVYLSRRSRPIPADQIQAIVSPWKFTIAGWTPSGVTTANSLPEYNAGYTVTTDWYNYIRQMGKAALKYKQTPTALVSNDTVYDFMNICFYALANTVALLNLDRMYQYNQAFSTLYTYLPSKMSRVKRLYRRLSAIFMPNFIKAYAIKMGMIPYVPGKIAPHLRFWDDAWLVAYGGAADYSAMTGLRPDEILLSDTHLSNFVSNIEKAVWALENNISFDANTATDFIAIKDAIDMIHDVPSVGQFYSQGLPDENSYPGLVADKSLLNDYYTRALISYDTHGVGDDEKNCFPVCGDTTFGGKVPVCGFGAPTVEDFTLFGAAKIANLNSTAGARVALATDEHEIYGTNFPDNPLVNEVGIYTREDGWTQIVGNTTDFGDGAGIRTFLNTGHPQIRHIFFPHLFAGQLDADFEFRFLDTMEVDYTIWMDEEDLGPNHAQYIAASLGIPYLK